jgi:GT2 family glycosyltransferase
MEMLALDENLGYAGGNNVGMRHAIAAGAQYVLVLNNDTVMDPDCVTALVTAAEKDPRIAAVGARVMQYEHRDRVYCIGGHLTWLPPLIRLDGLNATAAEVAQARDVEVVAGSSVLFRAGALRRIGYFDERFFAYHEDVDWCTRAREDGFRVTYAPDAMVLHRHAPGVGTPRAHPHLYYFYGCNAIPTPETRHAAQWQAARAQRGVAPGISPEILRGERRACARQRGSSFSAWGRPRTPARLAAGLR